MNSCVSYRRPGCGQVEMTMADTVPAITLPPRGFPKGTLLGTVGASPRIPNSEPPNLPLTQLIVVHSEGPAFLGTILPRVH